VIETSTALAADALTRINLDDLVDAFGWQGQPLLARALHRQFRRPARKFAEQMLAFDAAVGAHGLAEAARRLQRLYVRDVRVFGQERLPDGSILALANHPGMTDTLSAFAALGRADLKIIALDRPFLLSLPNVSSRLLFVTDDPNARVALVRRVSGHLRGGGSVLTFPAGHTEPDPDVYPGALKSLESWTESVGVFLRLAPETAVVPMLVRGVAWKWTAHHPITRLRRNRDDRELLASALQLLAMILFNLRPVSVIVQIGRPISVDELGTTDAHAIHQAVLSEMKRLIEADPEGEVRSVL
jgi:hypothetical protein